jgi:hypothetical protein
MISDEMAQHVLTLIAVRGIAATISRGTNSATVQVVLGRANNGSLTKENMRFEMDAQDILMRSADYLINGTLTEPMADDQISIVMQGKTQTFEVRPTSDSQQCFNNDPTGTVLRIHTKLISKN